MSVLLARHDDDQPREMNKDGCPDIVKIPCYKHDWVLRRGEATSFEGKLNLNQLYLT